MTENVNVKWSHCLHREGYFSINPSLQRWMHVWVFSGAKSRHCCTVIWNKLVRWDILHYILNKGKSAWEQEQGWGSMCVMKVFCIDGSGLLDDTSTKCLLEEGSDSCRINARPHWSTPGSTWWPNTWHFFSLSFLFSSEPTINKIIEELCYFIVHLQDSNVWFFILDLFQYVHVQEKSVFQ